jgi:hypothetical protein
VRAAAFVWSGWGIRGCGCGCGGAWIRWIRLDSLVGRVGIGVRARLVGRVGRPVSCMGPGFVMGTGVRVGGFLGFPQAVIHRGGRSASALAQWWACGGGGRTSPIWCCRPSAEAAGSLARCSVRSAVAPWTGPRRAGCDRCRNRPDCRSYMRRLGMRTRYGRYCWLTRRGGCWALRGRLARLWRGLSGRPCGRCVRRGVRDRRWDGL